MICRPSIIGCSYTEPFVGWVDSLSAAAALTFSAGLGILNYVYGSPSAYGDLIPVDYVCNSIIAGTAIKANKDALTIMTQGTSH